MARSDFAPELQLEPGLVIGFETPAGDEVASIIGEIGEEQVEVDFNHPLSGSDIAFTVQILEVSGGQ